MIYILVLIIILLIFSKLNKNNLNENYLNYERLPIKSSENNCPQIHANNLMKLQDNKRIIQNFGYTKNKLFYSTRFFKSDIPLPTESYLFDDK